MNYYLFIIITISIISCTQQSTNQIVLRKNPNNFELLNIHNNSIKITKNKKPKVFFALDPECPLCKSYSKTINEIQKNYKTDFDFYIFFPSKVFSQKKTDYFIEKNNYTSPLIIDTNQVLTYFLNAEITPECFVLDHELNIIYKGLIDDWVKEIGRKSQYIKNHYLKNTLDLYLKQKPIKIQKTKAIGCIIQK